MRFRSISKGDRAMRKPKAYLIRKTRNGLTYEYRGRQYTIPGNGSRGSVDDHVREQGIIDRMLDREIRVVDIEKEALECRARLGW